MADVVLKISGNRYAGWTEVRVVRSLSSLAHSFSLTLTDRFQANEQPRTFKRGDACELFTNDTLLITGYINDVAPEYDAENHTVRIEGRSKAGDLVDCSDAGKTFKNRTLLQIMQSECEPFGIAVNADSDIGAAFKQVAIEQGEPYLEFFNRLALIRALRITSTPAGDLLLTRAGTRRMQTPLVQGKNIKAASGQFSDMDQFSHYTVRSQLPGDSNLFGASAAFVEGTATDSTVRRYRPTVISSENPATAAECKTRAQWHRNTRHGGAQGVVYTVQDWVGNNAELWDYNALTTVRDPWIGIDGDRLIESVVFSKNTETGTETQLGVTDPVAFELIAQPEPNAQDNGWF